MTLSTSDPGVLRSSGAQRVLLAEDEELFHEVLGSFLRMQGYEVLHALDGEEAVRMAHEQHPDLILMDVMMPGMSGTEAMQHLKGSSDTAQIPILAVTASVFGRTEESTMQEGYDGYIPKPFTPAQLLAEIGRFLGSAA